MVWLLPGSLPDGCKGRAVGDREAGHEDDDPDRRPDGLQERRHAVRPGPGLLLRDILRGDPQAGAVAEVVAHVSPDVLILQGVDYDHGQEALRALRDLIGAAGAEYPHVFALQPNSGMASGRKTARTAQKSPQEDQE